MVALHGVWADRFYESRQDICVMDAVKVYMLIIDNDNYLLSYTLRSQIKVADLPLISVRS